MSGAGLELDADDAPFTRCDECEGIYVAGASHSCTTRRGTNTRDTREALAEADDRNADDTVLFLRGRSDSAYHEARRVFDLDDMTAELRPACGCVPNKREFDDESREYVQRAGRYPCGNCSPDVHETAGPQ